MVKVYYPKNSEVYDIARPGKLIISAEWKHEK